jgi:acetyl-CoA carboxylase biotin carboxyl carrier protein
MNIQEIKDIIQVMLDSGVAELEVQRGENRVWVRRSAGQAVQEVMAAPASAPAQPAITAAPAHPHVAAPVAPTALPDPAEEGLAQVKSPIVGTFYEAPSPGAPPFVKPGDQITPGKVLCIIESMKLMNEIESEASGVVVARLVENGSPVEYGQVLFTYRPA